jgi:hypothetical protein
MDLKAIKQRLNQMQKTSQTSEERKSMFWKPTIGKQTIRVVPSKHNPAMPFSEIFFHYDIDKPVMVSPINWGDKDPIVEFAAQLKKTNDKENWRLAKKIEPKARYFAPIIVRGEEDKGVRLWQFGKETYEAFLQLATHAPQPIQAAAINALSASSFGIGNEFPSWALPVFTDTKPPDAMIRSNELLSTTKSFITGNAIARQGSTTIVSPSLKLRMCN